MVMLVMLLVRWCVAEPVKPSLLQDEDEDVPGGDTHGNNISK